MLVNLNDDDYCLWKRGGQPFGVRLPPARLRLAGKSGSRCLEIYEMPGHLIRRMQQIAVSIFTDRIANAGYDLTPVQFACLNALEAYPGIDQATLAGLIAYDRVTIGGVVDRLEAKELVTRTVNKSDRRSRVLKLTPAGEDLLSETRDVVRQTQADILHGLNGREAVAFIELLQKAISAAEGESRAPFRPRQREQEREQGK